MDTQPYSVRDSDLNMVIEGTKARCADYIDIEFLIDPKRVLWLFVNTVHQGWYTAKNTHKPRTLLDLPPLPETVHLPNMGLFY